MASLKTDVLSALPAATSLQNTDLIPVAPIVPEVQSTAAKVII